MYNKNSGYGQALLNMVANQVPAFGRVLVVMDPDDTDEENYHRMQEVFSPDPNGILRFYTSLESAYAAAESNNNDVILLDGNSTHVIANGIAWSKNRIHVIGMDGGDRAVQQGAKVQSTVGAADAYVIKVTGVRNSFRNVKFIQADTNAAAIHVAEMGGEGNLYKNCSFTFGVADNLDLTTATEVVMGEDSGTFINCEFGQHTLNSTASARTIMTIDQVTTSQEFKDCRFIDCRWVGASTDADLQCISMAAAGDILYPSHFIRPVFSASVSTGAGTIACTKAVSTANGTVNGMICISYPTVFGFNDLGINGTNNDALWVFSHVPSATDITAVQPTTT